MTWRQDLKDSLDLSVDSSASWLRVLDFEILRKNFVPRVLDYLKENNEVPMDLQIFIKKLCFDLCILPTSLGTEIEETKAFQVEEERFFELTQCIDKNFKTQSIPPLFFSHSLKDEKLLLFVMLAALQCAYRGPLFLAGKKVDANLGFLNTLPAKFTESSEGWPRKNFLPLVSPGLDA